MDTLSALAAEDGISPAALILRVFPDEVRPILEWSIQNPGGTATVFTRALDDRTKALIRVFAQVGNAGSSGLLRSYVDDAELGAHAITAIKYLNGTQA
jgi:hypothetical protein